MKGNTKVRNNFNECAKLRMVNMKERDGIK